MGTLEDLERTVSQLSPEDLAAFRAWFAEFDGKMWDRRLEEDAAVGKLDKLAEQALQHLKERRCTDL
ncbi:MAG: hypothetical protein F6K21_33705 [Symploca sp. SIO2D2]|nr:hypothetical protein [Symploca sp. SIO2D2]